LAALTIRAPLVPRCPRGEAPTWFLALFRACPLGPLPQRDPALARELVTRCGWSNGWWLLGHSAGAHWQDRAAHGLRSLAGFC